MKLVKFRIKNYKSIKDSGDCYFSEGLTILAGMNESGKTSILEALEDFHEDKLIRDSARPNGESKTVTEVSVTFFLENDEIIDVLNDIEGVSIPETGSEMSFVKRFGDSKYHLTQETRENFQIPREINGRKQKIKKTIILAKKKFENLGIDFAIPDYKEQALIDYKNQIIEATNRLSIPEDQATKYKDPLSLIEFVKDEIDNYYSVEEKAAEIAKAFVDFYLPNFILFSSFEDEFPASIPLSDLETNEWIEDLERVSCFCANDLLSSDERNRAQHIKDCNLDFTLKFKEYWNQGNIALAVEKDGERINFWIEENGELYYPKQRSKGQQWYLSFFIKIVARLNEDRPNVILIDEPGLYLHAKAQKDLLKVLTNNFAKNTVVFSTHSPYLISSDTLENLRLIEKDHQSGTVILGKLHAQTNARYETLTPVLTAIGLGLNDSLAHLSQKNNVVVEGPEDVFYLQAFKFLYYKDDFELNFINGGGASNMSIVGSILEGWGCDVIYLYDNDKGARDGIRAMKCFGKPLKRYIKFVSNEKGEAITDLFSANDFKKYILNDEKADVLSLNSVHMKEQKKDKVLSARLFLQRVKDGEIQELDEESSEKVKKIFNELQDEIQEIEGRDLN